MNPTNPINSTNPTSPTHALITGGSGFIGSHLAEVLVERGYNVTVIDNLSTARYENIAQLTDRPRFRFAIDTITKEVVMDRLVSECDVIFHLAAAVRIRLILEAPFCFGSRIADCEFRVANRERGLAPSKGAGVLMRGIRARSIRNSPLGISHFPNSRFALRLPQSRSAIGLA
jgi:hypothetical protein